MTKSFTKSSILCLVVVAVATVFSVPSLGQDGARPRVSNSREKPKPKTTPTPRPTLIPTGPRIARITSHVRAEVNRILANPLIRRGRVGVRIDWLDRQTMIYSRNADKYFMPASNMKSYTVAAALDTLTPDFRFITSVYSKAKPDEMGTVKGNLIVYGRGDPSLSMSFNDDDLYKGIDTLAERIVQAGVKKIEGSIIGDETYFNTNAIPYSWEWDDLQWYYGAEISSLTVNDNAVELRIMPSTVGSKCVANISPINRQYRVINTCQTTAADTKREIRVKKKLDANIVEVSGNMPETDKGFKGFITISRPASLFVEMLKQRLQLKGVTVTGPTRAINLQERNGIRLDTELLTEIARHQSPPLSFIAAKTMKPSQNLYTELILRVLGEERGDKSDTEKTSARKGIDVVKEFLQKSGASSESIVQYDGSGLSRHNLITPNSAVKLYSYMARGRFSKAWQDSLTVGGVDGTLRNRFKATPAEDNVRGKTGTLNQVSALSGYVRAKSGERFVFSILTNNIPGTRLRTATIDNIVKSLAEFDSRESAEAKKGTTPAQSL